MKKKVTKRVVVLTSIFLVSMIGIVKSELENETVKYEEKLDPEVHDIAITFLGIERKMHIIGTIDGDPLIGAYIVSGNSDTINIQVENFGDFNETFEVVVWDINSGRVLQRFLNQSLSAGEWNILSFNWVFSDEPETEYHLEARAQQVPGETNIDNNFLDNLKIFVSEPNPQLWLYIDHVSRTSLTVTVEISWASTVTYYRNTKIDWGDGDIDEGIIYFKEWWHTYSASWWDSQPYVVITVTDYDKAYEDDAPLGSASASAEAKSEPVGGTILPVNKLVLLAPYID